MCEGVDWIQLA